MSATFCDLVTGMLEEHSRPMDVYPSPAHDGKFMLRLEAGDFEVKIFDICAPGFNQ